MSPIRAIASVVATAVLAGILPFLSLIAQAAEPVKIGALYPLSGQVAKSGEDTLNGIEEIIA